MGRLYDSLRSFVPNTDTIPCPRQLLQVPFLASLASKYNARLQLPVSEASCSSPVLSCPSEPQLPVDTCCMNYPAGHYLMTQFWDTSPPLGPDNSWTVHGLWPDYCNGGFPAFCDQSRSRSPEELTAILSEASKTSHPDLLKHMTHYWLSNDHRNSNLWSHEWNKHGTCVTTLESRCYTDTTSITDSTSKAILDYFTHTTQLFSTLNTFDFLEAQTILPSTTRTYTLSELESAIQSSPHAQQVTLRCNSRHELDEIWYHFVTLGPLRNTSTSTTHPANPNEIFIPVKPDGQISNCPSSGIKYLPKKSSSKPPPSEPHPPPPPSPPSNPFEGKGHLKVHILPGLQYQASLPFQSNGEGCLIRVGKWYVSGTCATYLATSDIQSLQPDSHVFTLQSSYAPCAILPSTSHHGLKGEFVCDKTLPLQSIFSMENSTLIGERGGTGIVLSYQNQTVFYADRVPGRFEKVGIFADDGEGKRDIRVEVYWEAV